MMRNNVRVNRVNRVQCSIDIVCRCVTKVCISSHDLVSVVHRTLTEMDESESPATERFIALAWNQHVAPSLQIPLELSRQSTTCISAPATSLQTAASPVNTASTIVYQTMINEYGYYPCTALVGSSRPQHTHKHHRLHHPIMCINDD